MGNIRSAVSSTMENIIQRPSYSVLEKLATVTFVFGEPVYRLGCSVINMPADESIIYTTRTAIAGLFGANLGVKLTARGPAHLKTSEAWIDGASIAAESVTGLGHLKHTRLLRLFRQLGSVVKGIRILRIAHKNNAIEDLTVAELQRDATWKMMAIIGSIPLVADFREDGRDPLDCVSEIAFGSVVLAIAKWQQHSIRKSIYENYTRILTYEKKNVEQMILENPSLVFLREELTNSNHNEITGLTKPYMHVLTELADMINPVGEDLTLDQKGNIETKELDAGVLVTDMRNFTSLTEQLGDEIFPMLRMTYFPILRAIIAKYHGKVLNHTGDGLIVYFTDQRNGIPKEEIMARCALEMNECTTKMADIFRENGCGTKEAPHSTGIGMATGPLRIGDILRMSSSENGTKIDLKKLHDAILVAVQGSVDFDVGRTVHKPGRIAGLGSSINLAARIESQNKHFPHHTCLMSPECYMALPEDLQKEFEPLEAVSLKGFEKSVTMYGKRMQRLE